MGQHFLGIEGRGMLEGDHHGILDVLVVVVEVDEHSLHDVLEYCGSLFQGRAMEEEIDGL